MHMESFVAPADREVAGWKEMDLLFASEATTLEYFTIGSDNETLLNELPEQFPELCKRNKFGVKLAKWSVSIATCSRFIDGL